MLHLQLLFSFLALYCAAFFVGGPTRRDATLHGPKLATPDVACDSACMYQYTEPTPTKNVWTLSQDICGPTKCIVKMKILCFYLCNCIFKQGVTQIKYLIVLDVKISHEKFENVGRNAKGMIEIPIKKHMTNCIHICYPEISFRHENRGGDLSASNAVISWELIARLAIFLMN